jgi:hypothetical protein
MKLLTALIIIANVVVGTAVWSEVVTQRRLEQRLAGLQPRLQSKDLGRERPLQQAPSD